MWWLCCPGKGRNQNLKKALSLPVLTARADDRGYINSVFLKTKRRAFLYMRADN